jgi:hypothetical protein
MARGEREIGEQRERLAGIEQALTSRASQVPGTEGVQVQRHGSQGIRRSRRALTEQ